MRVLRAFWRRLFRPPPPPTDWSAVVERILADWERQPR